jgi:hypothetical protein
LSLRYFECSKFESIYFKNPYAINEEPVSPGCTLAEMMINSVLFGLPRVNIGIFLPSKLRPNE